MASAKLAQTGTASAVSSLVLKLDQVEEDPGNARLTFDPETLKRLADSLRSQGQLQPVLVRLLPSGKYRLVDGHRRFRAADLAGLKEIRCELVELDDQAAALAAATANLQREDLTPYEQARAFKTALDAGMTKKELGERAGVVFNTIKARLELLELPESIGKRIGVDGFTIEHAQALLPLTAQKPLLDVAVEAVEKWTKAGRMPAAKETQHKLAGVLEEKGLVAKQPHDSYELDGLQAKANKLDAVQLKTIWGAPLRLVTDVKAFDELVVKERAARKQRLERKGLADLKAKATTKGPSLEVQARRGLRNVQPELMAQHVAKLDKWSDDLQLLLLESFARRAGMPARQKDQELLQQACGLSDDEMFLDDETLPKLFKTKPKQLHRLIAGLLFFAHQDSKHELVGDKYEAIYVLEGPAAKVLTGQTCEKTLDQLKARIQAEKAKKTPPAGKTDKKPKGPPAPASKAKAKAKPAKGKAAAKPVKVTPAVAKARAKLASKSKQASLPKANVELQVAVIDAALATMTDPLPVEHVAAEPVQG